MRKCWEILQKLISSVKREAFSASVMCCLCAARSFECASCIFSFVKDVNKGKFCMWQKGMLVIKISLNLHASTHTKALIWSWSCLKRPSSHGKTNAFLSETFIFFGTNDFKSRVFFSLSLNIRREHKWYFCSKLLIKIWWKVVTCVIFTRSFEL